jgi:hypothetical protein
MYGDKDRRLKSATKAMQEYQQLPNKAVRVYANRLKANWRRAGWNLITHEVVLYDMAWAGLRHALKTKVRPWISSGKDRFDTLDQVINCAAASEFKPDNKKPGGQQQQQRQTGESLKGGDKKRNFRPSISEPMENNSGNSNTSGNSNNSGTGNIKSGKSNSSSGGSRANLSPAPWLSKEIYESRKANRQCTRCGSGDHKPTFVPNTASQAHLNRTPAITAAMMANKSSAKSHSTRSSKKTSLPLSISNSTGEAGRDGGRIGKLGEQGLICNLG